MTVGYSTATWEDIHGDDIGHAAPQLMRLGSRAALASAAVSAVGLILWFARFAFPNSVVGWLNDVLTLIQYALAVPVAFAIHAALRDGHSTASTIATAVGMVGLTAVIALQAALIVGALTIQQQWLPVSIAILVVGAWLVATALIGRTTGRLTGGLVPSLVAVPYFGFPVWALWIAGRLRALGAT
jgi:hypothetical protein